MLSGQTSKNDETRTMSSTKRGGARRKNDQYFTPDDCAQACVDLLPRTAPRALPEALGVPMPLMGARAVEMGVGGGAFARGLALRGASEIIGVDIDPDVPGFADCAHSVVGDALTVNLLRYGLVRVIAGNPPFNEAEPFVHRALEIAPLVGFLLRLSFVCGQKRHRTLLSVHPPRYVYPLVERPSFTGGATDSCDYAFVIWERGWRGDFRGRSVSWRGDK